MICPACGGPDTRVLESRLTEAGEAVRRRRECVSCLARLTTFERVEQVPLWVVKRDGSRQPFDRAKLLRGLTHACVKRPVGPDVIEGVAAAIERDLRAAPEREIDSGLIGEAALRHLRSIDGVAYVRFASVYRTFADVEEFQRELDLLDDSRTPVR
jgi:transcriptional repressor NrdR